MPGGISSEVRLAVLEFMEKNKGEAESRDIKQVMEDEGKSYAPSRVMNTLVEDGYCEKAENGWIMTDDGYDYLEHPDEEQDRTSARRRERGGPVSRGGRQPGRPQTRDRGRDQERERPQSRERGERMPTRNDGGRPVRSVGADIPLPEINQHIDRLVEINQAERDYIDELIKKNDEEREEVLGLRDALIEALSPLMDLADRLGVRGNDGIGRGRVPNRGSRSERRRERVEPEAEPIHQGDAEEE